MKKGRLFVISAPSGAGKSTVLTCVRRRISGLAFSVSCTTRRPRSGERQGEDYIFVSRDEFKRMIAEGSFLEWAEVHGELYGTPRRFIEEAVALGKDVILDIDVQGGISTKAAYPEAVTVFLLPPSMAELENRLSGRATDAPEQIKLRLENAAREMKFSETYEHRIVNDDIEGACNALCSLIRGAGRQRGGA